VTFAHDEGVAKVGGDALPADLKKRFRMGMFPMLPEPPAPVPGVADAGSALPASAPAPMPESTADLAKREAERKKLLEDIHACEEKLITLNKARTEWSTRARDNRNQADSANRAGRPAFTFNQQAKQADQNADATTAQINLIEAELRKLRLKLLQQ
jgi:hypothetical protein